ncbi:hypothetical protein NYZ99_07060 [Maribacter litopenaei]|uniref:Lipoprotein n=1 Tax=Maribacter litopenaei TaxID=2976127 RepID=A0ABY5YD66_9FLAO|nr:hypothetical protein [Maribacter litopenaei]UWX56060.1 hypothetical protein NYZ99_07060 [Maribacter litopenaei]
MSKSLLAISVLVVCLCSCKSQEKVQSGENGKEQMELVLKGDHSGYEKEQLIKIDSKSDFEAFFGKINRTRKPGIPIPKVDFERKTIIIRLKGETTSNEPRCNNGKILKRNAFLEKKKANFRK